MCAEKVCAKTMEGTLRMKLKPEDKKRTPELSFDPEILAHIEMDRGLWHETELEIAEKTQRADDNRLLLRWVKREMPRRLTRREQQLLTKVYFQAQTLSEAAHACGCHPSTVARSLRRAAVKLRAAADEVAQGTCPRTAIVQLMRLRLSARRPSASMGERIFRRPSR